MGWLAYMYSMALLYEQEGAPSCIAWPASDFNRRIYGFVRRGLDFSNSGYGLDSLSYNIGNLGYDMANSSCGFDSSSYYFGKSGHVFVSTFIVKNSEASEIEFLVSELAAADTVVGTIEATDVDQNDSHIFEIISNENLPFVISILKEFPTAKFLIEGHTDNSGNPQFNMKLSKQRAAVIMNHFVANGIPADRFTTVGRGQSNPLYSNETEQGRINNRRVEVKLLSDVMK